MNEGKKSKGYDMPENNSLNCQKAIEGIGAMILGIIIGMALGFLVRIVLARSLTQSEFGVYSLGLAIVNISVAISLFGLQDGISRQIGYYSQSDNRKIYQTIKSSLIMVSLLSALISILLFLSSEVISQEIFHTKELYLPLKIYALAIPFLALTQLLLSIFRGFGKVKENIYFSSITINSIFLCITILMIEYRVSFAYIILGYTVSSIITFVLMFAYCNFNKCEILYFSEHSIKEKTCHKELLFFCLPLFAAYLLSQLMSWMDILILGYFTNTKSVGLYSLAIPVAQIISNLFYSSHFLVIPLVAQLYSQNRFKEIKENYKTITKWLLTALAPISIILMLFPEEILTFLYGSSSNGSAFVLQVFSLGYFIFAIVGPCGAVLLSLGKSRYLLETAMIGVIISALLNIILIPILDVRGAAIASVFSLVAVHMMYFFKLYYSYAIHAFDKNYLAFISSLILIILLIQRVLYYVIIDSISIIFIVSIPITAVCIIVLILTKNFNDTDKEIVYNLINKIKIIF